MTKGSVGRPVPGERPLWLAILLPLASAFVLIGIRDYRPFPSVDDFAYIPLAWAILDPGLFSRDAILQTMIVHAPAWPALVAALEGTVGLAAGYWVLTLALTIATMWGAYRLMRVLCPPALLFPAAALFAFAGPVAGLGRGAFDGALGDGFHVQWLALCLVLWSYAGFAERRPVLAGVLLGAGAIAHPVVAAHGAAVIAMASLFAGPERLRRLIATGLVTALVSAPVSLPLAAALLEKTGSAAMDPAAVHAVVADGFLFRTPHEFDLSDTGAVQGWLIGVMVLAGLAGAAILWRLRPNAPVGPVLGLLAGHMVLAGIAVILHGAWFEGAWRTQSVLPYMLHLTRTTPLLLVLALILFMAGIEAAVRNWGGFEPHERLIALPAVAATLGTLLVFQASSSAAPLAAIAGAFALLLADVKRRRRVFRALSVLLAAAGLAGLVHAVATDPIEAGLGMEERALYHWAGQETAREALFVIPPGLQGFRLHARRSVFVDFKTIPSATPELVLEWRRRLETIARPDRTAREARGWLGLPLWDRAYAYANTPERIAGLMADTGADYVVWDRHGLLVPPFLPAQRPDDPRVRTVYENDRFLVYARAGAGAGAEDDHVAGRR